jgi:SWI/SNF-related matrix-associated actin-dependent regulator of chromatin subfamily A3
MPPEKRRWEVIDLTENDDAHPPSEPSTKRPALSASQTSRLNSNSGRKEAAGSRSQKPQPSSGPSPSSTLLEPEVFDLTQDDDAPERELYSTHGEAFLEPELRTVQILIKCLENKIVGIRYYQGRASPGELVLCRREPENRVGSPLSKILVSCGQMLTGCHSMIRMPSESIMFLGTRWGICPEQLSRNSPPTL